MNNDLQLSTHNLLNHFLTTPTLAVNRLEDYQDQCISSCIAATYSHLESTKSSTQEVHIGIPGTDAFSHGTCQRSAAVLKAIQDEIKLLPADYLKAAILHGSYGDRTPVAGWSDVDLLWILTRKASCNARILRQLKRCIEGVQSRFIELDCLQHHGIQVLSEFDLDFYRTRYMPPEALTKAVDLMREEGQSLELAFHSVTETPEHKTLTATRTLNRLKDARDCGELQSHARNHSYLPLNATAGEYMYQLKYFISVNLLFPSQFLADINRACHKKDSFTRAYELFPPAAVEWFRKLEQIRLEWAEREAYIYQPNQIPAWLGEKLGSLYFEQAINAMTQALDSPIYQQETGH